MNRRTFNLSLLFGLLSPRLNPINKPKIVSCVINTSFYLEQIFTQGDLRIYPEQDAKPIIDVCLEYSDGSSRQLVSRLKSWRKRKWYEYLYQDNQVLLSRDSKNLKSFIQNMVLEVSEMKEI